MENDIRIWGIHTQDDNLFLKEDVIAIGWDLIGDLRRIQNDRESFKEAYAEAYPDASKQSIATSVGMIYRFFNDVWIGDYVVYPSKTNKQINIGVVEGDYYFDEDAIDYPHQRKVKWLKHYPRTSFSQGALYETGSFMSLFEKLC